MPLIGTAGHVDHGKSTLIEALTGRDPDRWAEEKRRGLTIDLGFAWATLPDGTEISFVDVPGHERYLKNMLAGVEDIDVALLVVAADEGWMPQSEEHLAVLDLLEVKSGVVALTKADAVDADLAELAHLEVVEKLEGTTLAGVDVVPVSAITGEGLDNLVARLTGLVSEHSVIDLGRPRLWVDRSFTASGSGTVVTGTLLEGHLGIEDQVRIYPGERTARIRGIQSHEKIVESVGPGRRVALNLVGVDRDEVSRGDMVGVPDEWLPSDRFAVAVRPARYVDDFDKRGAYQLHIGTRTVGVTVVGMKTGVAVMHASEEVPLAVGDRFIIRDTGRKLVTAGGRVLDPAPEATRAALQSAQLVDPGSPPDEVASRLLQIRGTDSAGTIAAHSKGGSPRSARSIGPQLVADEVFETWQTAAGQIVEDEHKAHPLRVGIPLATLAEQLGINTEQAETVVESTVELERIGPDVALTGRVVDLGTEGRAEWERVQARLGEGLDVPTIDELNADPELLHLQIRLGRIVRVSGSLVFLPDQVAGLRETIRAMPDEFTVADFRDATGLSRKYAVPLLEWADKEGLTVRRGDTRTVR